ATMGGAGVSINSLWSVHHELQSGALVQVLPDWRAMAATALWLVYPKSNVVSVKVRVFMDFLLERYKGGRVWSL
ncbi:MAG: LysR substrate-binding domain-containing protein, partial [Pseudomonadota bacterium]